MMKQSDSRTLITRVDVSPTHVVEFFADPNGVLMMVEGAKIGEPSVWARARKDDRSVVNLYHNLRPGEAVPPALVEAEERALALVEAEERALKQLGEVRPEVRPKMTPPPEGARQQAGKRELRKGEIEPMTAGDQSWFSANACTGKLTSFFTWQTYNPPNVCVNGWYWADAVFDRDAPDYLGTVNWGYFVWAENGSASTTNATLIGEEWNGSGWNRYWTSSIQPGWWWSFYHYGGNQWGHANISGGTDTASLAVRTIPFANGVGMYCSRHKAFCFNQSYCNENKPMPVGCKPAT
jgi:hypothetical protein